MQTRRLEGMLKVIRRGETLICSKGRIILNGSRANDVCAMVRRNLVISYKSTIFVNTNVILSSCLFTWICVWLGINSTSDQQRILDLMPEIFKVDGVVFHSLDVLIFSFPDFR